MISESLRKLPLIIKALVLAFGFPLVSLNCENGCNLILSLLATQIFYIHGHCTCMELLILSLALGVYGIN